MPSAEQPPQITLTDGEDDAFRKLLGEGLKGYNHHKIGPNGRQVLSTRVAVPDIGEPIGGLVARTSFGVPFIDLVYLPRSLRGSETGSRILAMAEPEGRRRGCSKAVLFTISFQAPEFNKKLGRQVSGDIAPKPPGATRIYPTKDL